MPDDLCDPYRNNARMEEKPMGHSIWGWMGRIMALLLCATIAFLSIGGTVVSCRDTRLNAMKTELEECQKILQPPPPEPPCRDTFNIFTESKQVTCDPRSRMEIQLERPAIIVKCMCIREGATASPPLSP